LCKVFWLEFFKFFPFCYEDAAVCVFQAFNYDVVSRKSTNLVKRRRC